MTSPVLKRAAALVAAVSVFATLGATARASSPPALRAGSGINSADTYLTGDITIQNHATLSLSQSVHDNATNADTTSMQLDSPATNFHIEAGYDTSNHLVFNMYPTDPAADPTTTLSDSISKVQYLNGQATVYDTSGNPMPMTLPQNPQSPAQSSFSQPGVLLGVMPAWSVTGYMVSGNPAQVASQAGGTFQTSTSNGQTVDQVTIPIHSAGGGTMVWTYQSSGGTWTMQQMTLSRSLPQMQMTSSVQMANLAWVVNSSGDSARQALATTTHAAPGASSFNPQTAALASASSATPQNQVQSFGPAAQNVVFQHGLFQNGGAWNRMRGWLNPLFEFGSESVPSLASTNRLASQGTDLVNLLNGTQNDSVLIGSSQGGLISRDVAQRRPDLATGVLTMDTPHRGALIDLTARVAVANALGQGIDDLAAAAGCVGPFDNVGCALATFLATFSFPIVNFAVDAAIPATIDLEPLPSNTYLTNLNSHAENFVRVGIEGHANKRWVLMRLGGDLFSNPDDTFGGRNIALATSALYFALRACEIIALLAGDFELAAFCGGIADTMNAIDRFWNNLTAGPDTSDGLVQGTSQHYPNATASYVINGADSHAGTVNSDKTRDRAIDALDRQFFVPRTGCQFLLSPNSVSVGGGGASGSFAVNTAVGSPSSCGWSAVSDVPWITIPSGTHGVGSGTVSYTVAANPSTSSSRSGTVTVSGLHFSVTQTPFPDFQLSISPSSQPVIAGNSVGYSVSASALNGFNGPVSLSAAVSPGGPGATLSAGSIQVSGGGSGSATLTLSTATSTTPGSYAVTVTGSGGGMTHSAAVALTVNPPPTPASGSIVINGSFSLQCQQDGTCPAPTNITVTIGGAQQGNTCYLNGGTSASIPIDPYGFNGASDNQGIANEIASAFNFSGSPVHANVADGGNGTWYVSFGTQAAGPNVNYLVEVVIPGSLAPLSLTVSPPNYFYGCNDPDGTSWQIGQLSGGH